MSNFPFKLNEPFRSASAPRGPSRATSLSSQKINKHENNLIMLYHFVAVESTFAIWLMMIFFPLPLARFKYLATILNCIPISPMLCFERKASSLYLCCFRYVRHEFSCRLTITISLQLQLGDLSNPELRMLTDQLEKIRFGGDETPVRRVSVRSLLPDTEHYMTYEGSTTSPACHETVSIRQQLPSTQPPSIYFSSSCRLRG